MDHKFKPGDVVGIRRYPSREDAERWYGQAMETEGVIQPDDDGWYVQGGWYHVKFANGYENNYTSEALFLIRVMSPEFDLGEIELAERLVNG